MQRQYEIILRSAKIENVMRYLSEKLRGMSGKVMERTGDDGTIYMYCIQNPRASLDKIEVDYTTTITPQGNVEKSYGFWNSLNAIRFECLQLQEGEVNTVRVKAECNHPVILADFDRYWAELLKDFGAVQVGRAEHEKQESSNSMDSVRDVLEISQGTMPLGLMLYKAAKHVVDMSPNGFIPNIDSLSPVQRTSRIIMSYAYSLARPKGGEHDGASSDLEAFKSGRLDAIVPRFAADFLRQFPTPSSAKEKFPRLISFSDFIAMDTLTTIEQILDLSVEEANTLLKAKPLVMDLKDKLLLQNAGQDSAAKSEKLPRQILLEKACLEWVNRDCNGYLGRYTREEFLTDFQERTGMFFTKDEFRRGLEYMQEVGRIININGRLKEKTSCAPTEVMREDSRFR